MVATHDSGSHALLMLADVERVDAALTKFKNSPRSACERLVERLGDFVPTSSATRDAGRRGQGSSIAPAETVDRLLAFGEVVPTWEAAERRLQQFENDVVGVVEVAGISTRVDAGSDLVRR